MKVDLEINDFYLIVGVFLGILLGIVFLVIRGRKQLSNRLLGILVLSLGLYMVPFFLNRFGELSNYPHSVRIHLLLAYLLGPTIFFYVRSSTTEDFRLKPIHLLHLIPWVLDTIYNVPFLMLSGTEKLQYFYEVRAGIIDLSYNVPAMIKTLHALGYFLFSVYAINQYRTYVPNKASYVDTDYHEWLLFFSGTLLVPMIAISIFVFTRFNQEYAQHFVVFSFFFFLFAVLIAALFKPALFHPFPHPIPENETDAIGTVKYQSSNLQEEQKEKYIKTLVNYMKDEEPFLEPELTLTELAKKLSILPNYLSQIINEKMGQNFMDYINGHRVETAKRLLLDPKQDHLTILSIAFEAGFNSKTAFYSAFKKVTGTNPTSYKKSKGQRA